MVLRLETSRLARIAMNVDPGLAWTRSDWIVLNREARGHGPAIRLLRVRPSGKGGPKILKAFASSAGSTGSPRGGTWTIAFVRVPPGYGPGPIELYDVQTGAVTRIVAADRVARTRPAWSPDSGRLAYQAPDFSIHVVRRDGSGDRIVAGRALENSAIAWS
jgi:hypothetical protein